MDNTIIEAAMAAIGTTFGTNVADFGINQIKSWFDQASQSVDLHSQVDIEHIEKLSNKLLKDGVPVLDAEITRRNLARWFEIPQEEFS